MSSTVFLARAVRREPFIVIGAIALLTAVSWLYSFESSGSLVHGMAQPWTASELVLSFLMWSIMMVGMMLPSATSMVLTYSAMTRRGEAEGALARTALFVVGYIVVWSGYSALAALLQSAAQSFALWSCADMAVAPAVSAGLLIAAGVFQWTPLKEACLRGCRTPLGFLVAEWRSGSRGALVMGIRHGLNCMGCCWAIMALLFVVGTMNLAWMAVLTVLCWVEKAAPGGHLIGRLSGLGLVLWGSWIAVGQMLVG
jgi:predicted metal-binding membrane protein